MVDFYGFSWIGKYTIYIPYMDAMGYGFDGWQARPRRKPRAGDFVARPEPNRAVVAHLWFSMSLVVIFISFCFPQNHRKNIENIIISVKKFPQVREIS